ncbi:MAG: GNAT family N-acetyltransferase [Vicinamibacterales bacterium]
MFIESLEPSVVLPAMDANMAAFWSEYGRASGCALETVGAGTWFYSGIPHPFFNGVPRAVFDDVQLHQVVDALGRRIREAGAPAFWWVGAHSTPTSIASQLAEAGINRVGTVPAMAIDLRHAGSIEAPVEGLSIQRVDSASQQAVWGRVAAAGSGFAQVATEALAGLEGRLAGSSYRAQHRYLGLLNGQPIAASAMVLAGGVAGIYAVATLPEARNLGIGRAMSVAPLLAAQDAGCHVAVLQASPAGYPIYRKIGFSEFGSYALHLQAK